MCVLPFHCLLEALKAIGNLASIALTEKGLIIQAASLVWAIAIFPIFLLLTAVSEVLLLPAILWSMGDLDWIGFAFVVGVYLLLVKLSLPAIDLVLDIGNYYLASEQERLSYYRPIEEAVEKLEGLGCRDIQILAHSLGTVITYDWLRCSGQRHPISAVHAIGSPLNKFWYLDHSRRRRLADEEAFANFPGLRWNNYWAWSDGLASGSLARFGSSGLAVRNERLRWLGVVGWSHVRYWKRPEVLDAVRRELVQ